MLRKLVFSVFSAVWFFLAASAGATTLPMPATWTMYSVGAKTYTNTQPLMESQAAAAAEYFRVYSLITPIRKCWRLYWGDTRSGPYTDAAWNEGWQSCSMEEAITSSNSDVKIAPPYACSPSSTETRCFLYGSASNAKNIGPCVCDDGKVSAGNPIEVGTGNKYQAETDFTVPGSPWLSLVRHYNSSPAATGRGAFGRHWSHSLSYQLIVTPSGDIELKRPEGTTKTVRAGTLDADENGQLVDLRDAQGAREGWAFDTASGTMETYDKRGRITRIEFKSGGSMAYAYSTSTAEWPSSVTDHFGRTVGFTYNSSNRVDTVTSPAGAVYTYAYGPTSMLLTVTSPDSAVRRYVMDETAHDAMEDMPGQLTGIVDESGARYATFKYDKYGRAYSTEHAGGAQKFTVSYGSDGVTNTVTTPTASAKKFTFANVLGILKGVSSGTTCTDGTCGQSEVGAFDLRGNRLSLISESGAKSCYSYDQVRNLLLRTVDGLAATADCADALANPPATARVTSMEWHPSFRKPTAIAGPLLRIAVVYDDAERVTSVTQTPTSDANGALGVSASADGLARTVSYTYNSWGQVLSATGPRAGEVLSYAYDTAGNILTTSNAAGHTTTYSSYTGDGRPQSIVSPTGAAATLTYDSRGRLKTYTEEGETTTLTYNGMSLLTVAAMPDGETLTYAYDLAQRLTSVTDSRGQKVSYTLNAAGAATAQQVTHANASVAVSVTRVYDMLGRIKQVTGAQGL